MESKAMIMIAKQLNQQNQIEVLKQIQYLKDKGIPEDSYQYVRLYEMLQILKEDILIMDKVWSES